MTKKEILSLLTFSIVITTFGLLADSDPQNPSLWTTIFEYFAMVTLIFILATLSYVTIHWVLNRLKQKAA